MSETKGRLRDFHRPQPRAVAASTPTTAKTACAPVSQAVRKQRLLAFRSRDFLNVGEHAGDQDQQRRPCGKGVVLLIGRDGEEEQRECGEEAEQPVERTRNLSRAT